MLDAPSVEIIIPVYNGAKVLPRLIVSLKEQTLFPQCSLRFLLTESQDESKSLLSTNGLPFEEIRDFDHAKTREAALLSSKADIAVLLTQDVYFKDPSALETLMKMVQAKVAIAYLRQRGTGIGVERYVRHCNYPNKSETRNSTAIQTKGLKAFFCSDACMAYNVALFKELNGYDGKAMPTNEDMYYARKVLLAGYEIHYCAASYVIHSHVYTLKKLYRRYRTYGQFFRKNSEFCEYSQKKAGFMLCLHVFGLILLTLNLYALITFLPNMLARFLGMRQGKRAGN